MMTLKLTGQFKKDLKKYKHATDLLEELEKVLKELQRNGVVSKEHNPAQGGLSVAGRCRCLTKDSNTSIEKEGYIPYPLQA
jgi:hypothetical protein